MIGFFNYLCSCKEIVVTNSSSVSAVFENFTRLKVLVIGDVMTDAYVLGKVERISPEAPVPVVHVTSRENRPGGAANVAINIHELGARAILCSVTGADEEGNRFMNLLSDRGLTCDGILQSPHRKTTVKTRVMGNNHQLLRVDDEVISDLDENTASLFISRVKALMENEKPDVLIFEDYDKGVLTAHVIDALTQLANRHQIPVAVDPKKKNFSTYKNVQLFKPNLHELKSGTGAAIDKADKATIDAIVMPYMKSHAIDTMMVTLSEAGVYIASKGKSITLPAHVRNISDVSGAGDTVISVAALCIGAGLPMETVAGLSNLAGGLVCEAIGVVPVNKELLMAEAMKSPQIFG